MSFRIEKPSDYLSKSKLQEVVYLKYIKDSRLYALNGFAEDNPDKKHKSRIRMAECMYAL